VTRTAIGLREAATLLDAWDAGNNAPELAKGAVVLAAASGLDLQGIIELPLAELAMLALRSHSEAFGDNVDVVVRCSACDALLDIRLSLSELANGDVSNRGHPATPREIHVGGRTFQVRPPTLRDLVEAGRHDDVEGEIVGRCVTSDNGDDVHPDSLRPSARAELDEVMEELAGPALPTLAADCPDCGERALAVVDPCALLWEAVDARAPTLLADIAVLASAFGWSEEAVLNLTGARRAAYLDLVGA
jgi:hypothetical protein